jgi:hypothetical protein
MELKVFICLTQESIESLIYLEEGLFIVIPCSDCKARRYRYYSANVNYIFNIFENCILTIKLQYTSNQIVSSFSGSCGRGCRAYSRKLCGNILINLKVPKCEIFDRSDFHDLYSIKPF